MADLTFGRCITPTSLSASLPASRLPSPVIGLTTGFIYPDIDSSNSSISSSSSDEAVEAKRAKLDPDYQPSTASESPLTSALHSQEGSENEKETDETDTETEESWCPSRSTSPEIISSPDDD
jgi:hypothetical protein